MRYGKSRQRTGKRIIYRSSGTDYGVMRATLYKTRSRNTAAWCKPGQEIEGTGGGEPEAKANVRRPCIGQPDIEGCD